MPNGQDIFGATRRVTDPYAGGEQFTTPDITSLMGGITPTEKIGWLERPGRFVSELLQGGDPMRALLRGRATKPSLGYAAFPEAQKKGFQFEDIGAFGVDVLADPLTYLLPPLIGKVGQLIKGGAKAGKVAFYADQVNDIMSKVKAEELKRGSVKAFGTLRSSLKKLLKQKGMTREEQQEIIEQGLRLPDWRKGMNDRIFRRQQKIVDLDKQLTELEKGATKGGIVDMSKVKDFKKMTKQKKALQKEIDRWQKGGYEPIEALDREGMEKFVAELRSKKFYANPPATGAFGNARRAIGVGLAPIVNVARRYGGHSGIRLADALEDLGRTSTMKTGAVYRDLAQVFKEKDLTSTLSQRVAAKLGAAGSKEAVAQRQGVREASTLLTEAGIFDEVPKGLTPEFLRKAETGLSTAKEAVSKAATKLEESQIMEKFAQSLGPRISDPRVQKLIDVIQNHRKVSDHALRGINDTRAIEVGRYMRDYYRANAQRLGGFMDASGRTFMVQGAKGQTIPFSKAQLGDDYVSHMWDYEEMKRGTKSFDQMISKMAKEQNISNEQARLLFEEQMFKVPKKFANVERSREMNIGGYILDPMEILPRYAHNTEYRLAFAERFGVRGDGLLRLVDDVKKEGLLPDKYMNNIRDMALGRNKGDYGISDIVNKVTGWQVLTKMGVGSTIANASQPINAGVIYGVGNMMKALPRMFTKEGQKIAAGAYSKQVHNLLKAQAGVPATSPAATYLDIVGFGPVERWNGFYSAVMGDTAAVTLASKLPLSNQLQRTKMLDKLKKWGADPKELQLIAETGAIPARSRQLIAAKAVELTQHALRWEQMPMMWQNDFARVMLQYKNFAYNQTRFVFREAVDPAVDYLATFGKQGDLRPLLRMAPLFIGAGEAVTHMRDLVRAAPRGVLTGDYKKREDYFWKSDDWMLSMLRDTLMVGSAGMLGDLWTSAERGKLPEWLLGPTLSDITELGTKAARAGRKVYRGEDIAQDFETFRNWAYRRAAPGLGPLVPSGVDLEKVAGRLF